MSCLSSVSSLFGARLLSETCSADCGRPFSSPLSAAGECLADSDGSLVHSGGAAVGESLAVESLLTTVFSCGVGD